MSASKLRFFLPQPTRIAQQKTRKKDVEEEAISRQTTIHLPVLRMGVKNLEPSRRNFTKFIHFHPALLGPTQKTYGGIAKFEPARGCCRDNHRENSGVAGHLDYARRNVTGREQLLRDSQCGNKSGNHPRPRPLR
ncbi:hypothetical protein CSUI_002408 [Cystoisospora suis]|uniref:Uncharacterized protein n=1 Tax=Cystoisospora suis TaxID=483139 RepID=A0A2C6L9E5_9APIC|nr:hypothetical protein CSUI_002408 [Cystoisospora suis]